MPTPIPAIQTEAFGCLFRSRLEARCAVFLEAMGLRWDYEPEGYELPSGRYLPDFKVYKEGCPAGYYWIECKGGIPTDQEVRLARELAKVTTACVVFFRQPFFQLMREQCASSVEFFESDFYKSVAPFSTFNGEVTDPWDLNCKDRDSLFGDHHWKQFWDRHSIADQDLMKLGFDMGSAEPWWPLSKASKAATAALSARFEHGEAP
jgi:hypothetical protein